MKARERNDKVDRSKRIRLMPPLFHAFSPLVVAARSDTERRSGRVSPFIFSLTVIIPPTLCGGHPRARRFSTRKVRADGCTPGARARAVAVVTKADQITTGAGIKAGGKKKEAAFALPRKKAHPRIRLSSVRFVGSAVLPFRRSHRLHLLYPSSRSSFSYAISLDDPPTARALRHELTSRP